jgi:hypothetical protein
MPQNDYHDKRSFLRQDHTKCQDTTPNGSSVTSTSKVHMGTLQQVDPVLLPSPRVYMANMLVLLTVENYKAGLVNTMNLWVPYGAGNLLTE